MREIDRRRSSFGEDSGGDSVRENHFHGRNMDACKLWGASLYGWQVDGEKLCILFSSRKFPLCGATSSSWGRATDVNVRMHRRCAIMSLPDGKVDKHSRDSNICHSSHMFQYDFLAIYPLASDAITLALTIAFGQFSRSARFHHRIFGTQKKILRIFGRITFVIVIAYNRKNSLPLHPPAMQEFRSALELAEGYKRAWVMFGFTGVFAQKRLHGKRGVVHTLITP